jgi:hypothetical protein
MRTDRQISHILVDVINIMQRKQNKHNSLQSSSLIRRYITTVIGTVVNIGLGQSPFSLPFPISTFTSCPCADYLLQSGFLPTLLQPNREQGGLRPHTQNHNELIPQSEVFLQNFIAQLVNRHRHSPGYGRLDLTQIRPYANCYIRHTIQFSRCKWNVVNISFLCLQWIFFPFFNLYINSFFYKAQTCTNMDTYLLTYVRMLG